MKETTRDKREMRKKHISGMKTHRCIIFQKYIKKVDKKDNELCRVHQTKLVFCPLYFVESNLTAFLGDFIFWSKKFVGKKYTIIIVCWVFRNWMRPRPNNEHLMRVVKITERRLFSLGFSRLFSFYFLFRSKVDWIFLSFVRASLSSHDNTDFVERKILRRLRRKKSNFRLPFV